MNEPPYLDVIHFLRAQKMDNVSVACFIGHWHKAIEFFNVTTSS